MSTIQSWSSTGTGEEALPRSSSSISYSTDFSLNEHPNTHAVKACSNGNSDSRHGELGPATELAVFFARRILLGRLSVNSNGWCPVPGEKHQSTNFADPDIAKVFLQALRNPVECSIEMAATRTHR
jgi:hypothetical protein